MVSPMKLFRRKKRKEEVIKEPEEESVVKVTESASTEASSDGENPANKDVLDELVEQGYDPENGGRLMLLQSISYEFDGDRYALAKGAPNGGRPEHCEYRDYSWEEDEYSRDAGSSQSPDSTFYSLDTQEKNFTTENQGGDDSTWSSPKRKINRLYKVGSKNNVIKSSWSLQSAGSSIAENNIYHPEIKGPLPSDTTVPSFLERVKSTPIDVGPADPPGQILDKYRGITGVQSNEVSVLSMDGAEAEANGAQVSGSTVSSVSNVSSSRNGSSGNSSSYLSSSLSESVVVASSSSRDSQSTISDDKSQVSNNRWGWLSKPTPSFLLRRKKGPITEEESPETKEYNKHRDGMQFQTAPSFVTGTFVSSARETSEEKEMRDDDGAVECMIVPERALSDLPEKKNLPPTPRRKSDEDEEEEAGFPEIYGQHFDAMKEYWKSKETSNGHSHIPRPPTFDPESLPSNMSMEEQILLQAMSMGSMDVIPVPRKLRKSLIPSIWPTSAIEKEKPAEVSIKSDKPRPKKSSKKDKLDFTVAARSKEEAVEVAMEPKRSRLSKLKISSSGSRDNDRKKKKGLFQKKVNYFEGTLDEDENVVRELKGLFGKKKKPKYFEGVLEEDGVVEQPLVKPKGLFRKDGVVEEPLVKPKGLFRKKNKAKRFEGVLEEDYEGPVAKAEVQNKENEKVTLPRIAPAPKPDPIAVDAAVILKGRLRTPLSPQSPASMAKNDQFSQTSSETQSFDVPRNVMIHPDLGQDTMEEERVADEIVGFVKLMPVALMSFFKKNPNEDELIRSLQPKGRIPKRKGSSLSSMQDSRRGMIVKHGQDSFVSEVTESSALSGSEDSQKQMNFMELTPSVVGDLPEEETRDDEEEGDSERTEKRRGGMFRKLGRKKGGKKANTTTRKLKTPRMTRETIEEMAEKEIKQKIEEGVEMIAGVTRQGQKAIVISNTKRHPHPDPNPEQVYHA